MSTNETYELFGGVLYNTPVDETSEQITSDNFIKACAIADEILKVRNVSKANDIIKKLDKVIVDYMNSPLIDFFYIERLQHYYILYAARDGNLNVIKYLYMCGWDIKSGTAWAATNGHLDIVKYIVETNGHNKHQYDLSLHNALSHGYIDIAKYLQSNGANIFANASDSLEIASKYGYLDSVKYIMTFTNGKVAHISFAYVTAIENGQLNVVKYFIEDVKINFRTQHRVFLYHAIVSASSHILQYLYEYGTCISKSENWEDEWNSAIKDFKIKII